MKAKMKNKARKSGRKSVIRESEDQIRLRDYDNLAFRHHCCETPDRPAYLGRLIRELVEEKQRLEANRSSYEQVARLAREFCWNDTDDLAAFLRKRLTDYQKKTESVSAAFEKLKKQCAAKPPRNEGFIERFGDAFGVREVKPPPPPAPPAPRIKGIIETTGQRLYRQWFYGIGRDVSIPQLIDNALIEQRRKIEARVRAEFSREFAPEILETIAESLGEKVEQEVAEKPLWKERQRFKFATGGRYRYMVRDGSPVLGEDGWPDDKFYPTHVYIMVADFENAIKSGSLVPEKTEKPLWREGQWFERADEDCLNWSMVDGVVNCRVRDAMGEEIYESLDYQTASAFEAAIRSGELKPVK